MQFTLRLGIFISFSLIKRNEAKKNLAKINPADPQPNTDFGILAAYAAYSFLGVVCNYTLIFYFVYFITEIY